MTKAGHADSPVNAVRKPEVRVAGRRRGRAPAPPSGPRARFPSARTAVRSAQGGEGPSVTPGDPADRAQARAPPSAGGTRLSARLFSVPAKRSDVPLSLG